jgi:hypothetical protein
MKLSPDLLYAHALLPTVMGAQQDGNPTIKSRPLAGSQLQKSQVLEFR